MIWLSYCPREVLEYGKATIPVYITMLADADVISLTSERFSLNPSQSPSVVALEKGGSERKFYRVSMGGESMIFVKYSSQKEENRHYVDIARFLQTAGVPVPEIYHHDSADGLIWMQDLGELDLWSFRNESRDARMALYTSTLDGVLQMHLKATALVGDANIQLERVFDKDLYLWEQGYFFENCLQKHFLIPSEEVERLSQLPALLNAASDLAKLPRSLVHRDFQSQNIMIADGSAWLIDFQGMRFGLPQYDLASLLYDPYVTLTDSERDELVEVYKNRLIANGGAVDADFNTTYKWCAVQRLMQALGAYGFLGHQKGRTSFLAHIPAAIKSLQEVASGLDGLEPLLQKLKTLP